MKYCFFLIITFSATLISKDKRNLNEFIIWNIGQGQWTTLLSEKYCDHFDMGGEYNLSIKVKHYCGDRPHRIHFSHWDYDHIGLISKFKKIVSNLCLFNVPNGKSSINKRKILENIPHCSNYEKSYKFIYGGSTSLKATVNETSEVVETHQILIPGDSPKKEEKKWAANDFSNYDLTKIQGLVLSHHGSHTSTSETLLSHVPKLKWAIASARKKRFGHPHPEVLARLKEHKTPVLLTEDWGSIVIRLE